MNGFMARTTEAVAYAFDDGDTINVRVLGRTESGRVTYGYSVWTNGAMLTAGNDVHSGVGDAADAAKGLDALVSFLGADAEKYMSVMDADGDKDWIFNGRVAEWAYMHDDELSLLRLDLEDERESDQL